MTSHDIVTERREVEDRRASLGPPDPGPLPVLAGLFRLVVDDGGIHEENCDAATFADAVAWAWVTARTTGRTVTLEHDLTDLVLSCETSPGGTALIWRHGGHWTTPHLFAATVLDAADLVVADCTWSIFRPNGCVAVDFAADEVTARGRAGASHDRYAPTEPPYRVEPTRIG